MAGEEVSNNFNFWKDTAPFVNKGMAISGKNETTVFHSNNSKRKISEIKVEILGEIKYLWKKADIKISDFPFKVKKNNKGQIEKFVPKGKNENEIKENIIKYRDKIKEAHFLGKIDDDEFTKLNDNLKDLMEENKLELETENIEITNDEIQENIKGLIEHNFGEISAFEKFCEKYNDLDLDERKDCLTEFNSKINIHLGIAGELKFSSNPNLKFENSFTKNGYYLTEKEISARDLKPMLYSMMEKSLIRQKEIRMGEKITAQRKAAIHKKILEERNKQQEKRNANQARKMMKMYRTAA